MFGLASLSRRQVIVRILLFLAPTDKRTKHVHYPVAGISSKMKGYSILKFLNSVFSELVLLYLRSTLNVITHFILTSLEVEVVDRPYQGVPNFSNSPRGVKCVYCSLLELFSQSYLPPYLELNMHHTVW